MKIAFPCWHKFDNWQVIRQDEIGGQSLIRHCVKCQRKQFRFASNGSAHAD